VPPTDRQLEPLLKRHAERVKAILNILVESAYFYRTDAEELFHFLRRHRKAFAQFFQDFYGWSLIMDAKCARVYKHRWHNAKITPSRRTVFEFTRRDHCIAFMLLLEFFENQLEEHAMTVDDADNLRFRFGDLLLYTTRRFQELFPKERSAYTAETIRSQVLRSVMPELEKYRFLEKVPPPKDGTFSADDVIYEALPALYHYNAHRLSQAVESEPEEPGTPEGDASDQSGEQAELPVTAAGEDKE